MNKVALTLVAVLFSISAFSQRMYLGSSTTTSEIDIMSFTVDATKILEDPSINMTKKGDQNLEINVEVQLCWDQKMYFLFNDTECLPMESGMATIPTGSSMPVEVVIEKEKKMDLVNEALAKYDLDDCHCVDVEKSFFIRVTVSENTFARGYKIDFTKRGTSNNLVKSITTEMGLKVKDIAFQKDAPRG